MAEPVSTLGESLDIDDALPVEPARAARLLLYVIAGFIVIAFVWAAAARLDRVTRGEGRVVPSSLLQEVQYLEGGIVKEILVKPGAVVKRGDLLVRLDPTRIEAEFMQGRDGYNLLTARIARLDALVNARPLAFPEGLAAEAPEVVAAETRQYEARLAEFNAAAEVERARVEEARAALKLAEDRLALANEELALIRPLVAKGIESQIELLRARQRLVAAEGEMQGASVALSRVETELRQKERTFFASTGDDLARAKAEMATITGELPALRDKVQRTELRAPIDGIVNRVLVATIGGVVKPGDTVVEVVPQGETPLIEARIKQADIGFLRVGQPARVKLTAYDSSVYGSIEAHIEAISPDAIEDPQTGERFFQIRVRTQTDALPTRDGPLQIMPGMAASVDILNGKRTVLAYLFKPVAEVSNKALREN